MKVKAAAALGDFEDLKINIRFYERESFLSLPDPPICLFPPMTVIEKLFKIQGPRRGDEAEQLDIPVR